MVEAQGAILPKDALHDRPDCTGRKHREGQLGRVGERRQYGRTVPSPGDAGRRGAEQPGTRERRLLLREGESQRCGYLQQVLPLKLFHGKQIL